MTTYLAQIEFGSTEAQSERPSQVLRLGQLTTTQRVFEPCTESIFPEIGRYAHTDILRSRVASLHDHSLR